MNKETFSSPLPSQVFMLITYFMYCKEVGVVDPFDDEEATNLDLDAIKLKPFHLSPEFVNVVRLVLNAHDIPTGCDPYISERCLDQVAKIVWDNIDDIIEYNKRDFSDFVTAWEN